MRRLLAPAVCALSACAASARAATDDRPAPPPVAAASSAGTVVGPAETRPPVSWRAILERPRGKADARIAYGPGPSQFGELWLPRGLPAGSKAPVVVLVHGGCWQSGFGLDLMDLTAADLRDAGFAVWNIEYRRLGEPGGGYPGTFQDVAAAVDALRGIARERPLDLGRVAAVGHSAGGHLAAWATLRPALPKTSPLRSPDPLPIRGLVSLAGILDLADYRDRGSPACGVPGSVDQLVDAAHRAAPGRYADTSPAVMIHPGPRQIVLSAEKDVIVDPAFAARYGLAYRAGAAPVRVVYPGAGHFELIDPTSAVWPDVVRRIRDAAGVG